jgi:hypothetical protein
MKVTCGLRAEAAASKETLSWLGIKAPTTVDGSQRGRPRKVGVDRYKSGAITHAARREDVTAVAVGNRVKHAGVSSRMVAIREPAVRSGGSC